MSKQGKYNPTEPLHGSSLFSFGEVPVASSKLNTWNGNIEAALNWAVQSLAILLGGQERDFILDEETGQELKVIAQNPPGLTVRVEPGKAVVSQYFAGLDSEETVPSVGGISIPNTYSRYDLVYLDRYGTIGLEQGSESADPTPPSTPPDALALALLYLRPGMSTIQDEDDEVNGYIQDIRPLCMKHLGHQHNADRTPVEDVDGSRTQFSTAHTHIEGSLEVYVNGLLQVQGSAYTADPNRQGYTFSTAPPEGYHIEHRYLIEE